MADLEKLRALAEDGKRQARLAAAYTSRTLAILEEWVSGTSEERTEHVEDGEEMMRMFSYQEQQEIWNVLILRHR